MVSTGVVCVIPARGGSKRIEKKNIHPFKGIPMLGWTVRAASQSGCFEKVIVSTDDPEIAAVAVEFGAEVPFLRSKNNSGDFSRASDATIEVINMLKGRHGLSYDTVVQMMPNCPLRDMEDVRQHIGAFINKNRNSQISVFRYGWQNPWWAHKMADSGELISIFDGTTKARSQDLPEIFCPTGAIWISKVDSLLEARTFYSGGVAGEEIDWKKAVDIDDYNDLEMAGMVWDNLNIN